MEPEIAAAILTQTLFQHTTSLQNLLASAADTQEKTPRQQVAADCVRPYYKAMLAMVKEVSSGKA